MFGVVGVNSVWDDVIVTSQRLLGVLLFPLSTRVLYKLKMVTSFLVKSVEHSESQSCPIERRLVLIIIEYFWACVAAGGNVDRVKWMESVAWITVLSGRRTWGLVV